VKDDRILHAVVRSAKTTISWYAIHCNRNVSTCEWKCQYRRCYKSKTRYRASRTFINYWQTIKPVVTSLSYMSGWNGTDLSLSVYNFITHLLNPLKHHEW